MNKMQIGTKHKMNSRPAWKNEALSSAPSQIRGAILCLSALG